MAYKRAKILVIEDELDISELICMHLGREGYDVESVADGEAGLKRFRQDGFDLLIVDWMLPAMSGLEITRAIRQESKTPVLMVTARMEATDIILGLEAGADDYVTKPFEVPVLMARVRALLRRSQIAAEGGEKTAKDAVAPADLVHRLAFGPISIDTNSYEVSCDGKVLSLTLSEYKLLLALAQNRGRVLTRDQLIDCVQGAGVTVVDRSIDTHVFGLRKKLGECAEMIETVRGVGYRVRSELT